ncbi:MAG: CC0125/CC1285 family lipoprotein [Pseudobdellovibrio sp.]
MKSLLSLILTGLLTACAAPSYQRANADGTHRTGYSETRLTANSYRVIYLDGKADTVYVNFLKRASELTLENGYKYFITQDDGASKENSMNLGIGYGSTIDVALPRKEATVVFKNEKSDNAIDASEFLKNNPIPKDVHR